MAVRTRVCGWEGEFLRQWSEGSGTIAGVTTTLGAARSGGFGLRIAASASSPNIQGKQNAPVATDYFVGRIYFRYDSALPAADSRIMMWSTGTTRYRLLFRTSDDILRMEHDTAGVQNEVQNGPAIVADQWYRLDFLFIGQSATEDQQMQWKIDGIDQPTLGPNNTYLGGITFWTLGTDVSSTFTLNFDDMVSIDNTDGTGGDPEAATVLARYPIGEGYVKRLATTGVGTHNTESAFGTSAGTIADSWQLLDQLPMNGTTEYITQPTLDTAAYLEYLHDDLALDETTINAIAVYAGLYNNSGIATSDLDVHVLDGASDIHYLSSPAGTAVSSRDAGLTTGPFTRDDVNALRTRVGYSSDNNPVPRCASVFFEVDVEQGEDIEAYWGVALS